MIETFILAADGTISRSKSEPEPDPSVGESGMQSIIEKLHDPQYSGIEVMRLILKEQLLAYQALIEYGRDPSKALNAQLCLKVIETLSYLAEQVLANDATSNRDVLNLDGPKFKYFFAEIKKVFEGSLKKALGSGSGHLVQDIMSRFDEIMAQGDQELRIKTASIGNEEEGAS